MTRKPCPTSSSPRSTPSTASRKPTRTSSQRPDLQGATRGTMHTISLMRGPFQLCDPSYETVVSEKLVDARNFAAKHEDHFGHNCPTCYARNRPLLDDLLLLCEQAGN